MGGCLSGASSRYFRRGLQDRKKGRGPRELSLLICDEPTTALDVTIQAQILQLIDRMKTELGTAVMLITHDMGVVSEMVDQKRGASPFLQAWGQAARPVRDNR